VRSQEALTQQDLVVVGEFFAAQAMGILMMMKRSYMDLILRLRRIEAASANVRMRLLGRVQVGDHFYDMFAVDVRNENAPGPVNVCISAGMHGDEPASVEAMVRFLEQSCNDEELLKTFSFVVFPCDNPSGYELETRENALGIDLNRQFHTSHPAPEVQILAQAVEGVRFDHVYELHEDVDSYGFYLYELAADNSLRIGHEIVQTISASGYPVNLSDCIEGREARCGVIGPNVGRMRRRRLPKAVYMFRLGAPHVLTLETPGYTLPLEDRVEIHLIGLNVALKRAREVTV
jgi:murein peptide amidase A